MRSNAPLKVNLAEISERRTREQRDRMLAVIAEFGGEKRQPMLVPEDDPANNELMLRLADEVLFLHDQIRRIVKVMELVRFHYPGAFRSVTHDDLSDSRS
jgi:hypothetical protein